MTDLAARTMAQRLTVPFRRGADTLALALVAAGDAAQAAVAPYDFAEHFALFGELPEPRYLLVAARDVAIATRVVVDYDVLGGAATGSASVTVPAGSLQGASFALDLGADEGASAVLRRLHMTPAAGDGEAANAWGLTALLGNTAKLLWVVGWERDAIRRHLERVQAQRRLPDALGFSLDLLGNDLGVPRFPPLPSAFDAQTIALYHLDERAAAGAEVDTVEDAMARYGAAGHPGQNVGKRATSGAAGRFGDGFAFRDPNAEIRVDSLAALAFAPGDDFTVECFVKPDAATGPGHVIAKHANPDDATRAGWALTVGEFSRGIPLNARFLLGDGARQVGLFADQSLPTDRFTHLAGVVDRAGDEARLYVNGVLGARASLAGIGALTNTEPVRIGRAATAAYQGVVDEVRLSRGALAAFHPVLGESDSAYRRRLAIFARWTLPTAANLRDALNGAVGPINGETEPLIVNDANATLISGVAALTITPQTLAAGACMDTEGNRRVREADTNGTAAQELSFDPLFLTIHQDARATYTAPPARTLARTEAAPDPHKMQLGTMRALNRLLDLLAGSAGKLHVESAFDPRADDLRAVGRAVMLTHETVDAGRLAALAQQAGFTFVCHRNDAEVVYASVAPGDYLDIVATGGTATPQNGFDALLGQTLQLEMQPPLPLDAQTHWLTVNCGSGRATIATKATGPTITLNAAATGTVNVKVETTLRRHSASGTRAIRIGLADLPDGQSLAEDGSVGAAEEIAGEADPFFRPSYLVTHQDGRATYGSDLNHRRMQPSVAARLNRLLDLIAGTGAAGQLEIVEAFVPAADGPRGAGRALTLRHASLAAGPLGALAHAAGFTYIRRQANQILVRQRPDDLIAVTGATQIGEGATSDYAISPRALPQGVAVAGGTAYVANSGTDTTSEIDAATGHVRRAIKVGWSPGAVAVSPDGARLYTADTASNTITAIDLATGNQLAAIAVANTPAALVHHPTQPRLYVACQSGNTLVEVDTAGLTVLSALVVGNHPTGLAITPDGKEVWVAVDQDMRIAIVTTAPFAASGAIALAESPLGIALAPDGAKGYVTFPQTNHLAILDVAARTVGPMLPVADAGGRPSAVAVAPDGSAVYVTDLNPASERLHWLKADGTHLGSLHTGPEPRAVAASGSNVFVINRGNDSVSVIAAPAMGLANTWRLGSGLGERLTWVLRPGAATGAQLSSATAPTVTVRGERAGPALLRAIYALDDNAAPYTFEVRLKPALEAANAVIRKDQFDLIMNILNALHPVGVEVITGALRAHVVEVRDQPFNAFPDYTYPAFRARGSLLGRPRKE